jgi:hypothetical protein
MEVYHGQRVVSHLTRVHPQFGFGDLEDDFLKSVLDARSHRSSAAAGEGQEAQD